MPFPVGMVTRVVSFAPFLDLDGNPIKTTIKITPSRALVWAATGATITRDFIKLVVDATAVTVELPTTDQSGIEDGAGNTITDWVYTASYDMGPKGGPGEVPDTTFALPLEDDSTLPIPRDVSAQVVGGTVNVPFPVEGPPGPPGMMVFYVTDAPTVPEDGESKTYFVTSSVVWPPGLIWSTEPDNEIPPIIESGAIVSLLTAFGVTFAVLGATFDLDAVPDTTPPTAPTSLAADPAVTSVLLTWAAATDDVGVLGYEYRIGAGSWVDAGSGLSENVTGLAPSTAYTFDVRAYDSAGNRGPHASVSTTTDASLTPFMSYMFNEGSGGTAAETSGKEALIIAGAAWTASGHAGPGITSSAVGIHAAKTYTGGLYSTAAWDGLTYGAWIKGGTNGAQIRIDVGGVELFIGVKDNTFIHGHGGTTPSGTQGPFDVDVWHHFCISIDFTGTTTDPYTMFFDGTSAGIGTMNLPHSGSLVSALVGSYFDATNSIVDGFRIYDRALTAEEVLTWMAET